jgi:hypothetical protein
MQREIMFHLGDPSCGIRSIKCFHLNYGRAKVLRKLGRMRTLVMGRVVVILIIWFLRRGRVLGRAHEVVKGGFEVFDVGTFSLEDLNSRIY